MRCYGNVKGRKYYTPQVLPEDKPKKRTCPTCGYKRLEAEFVVNGNLMPECIRCRGKYVRNEYGR